MQRTVTAPSSLEVPQPTNRVEQLEGTLSSQSQGMSDPFGYLQTQRAMACNKYTGRDLTSYSGHSRSLREGGKESTGTEGESSASSLRSQSERERRRKVPSQKAMLSKALQKANHAVLLDNAQNFEGAMEAYGDACDLLQQVMIRSSGDDDRKKLEAIVCNPGLKLSYCILTNISAKRNTYRSRVDELRGNEPQYQTTDDIKALPERPTSHDSTEQELFSPISDDEEDEAMIGTATVTQVTYDQSHVPDRRQPRSLTREQLPPRRQSLLSLSASEEARRLPGISTIQDHLHPNTQSFASTEDPVDISLNLGSPMEKEYMPPPLSPRRPRSPSPQEKVIQRSGQATVSHSTIKFEMSKSHHSRQETVESTSWLDTIDESGDSSASSVHSRTSFRGLRRKYIRAPSGVTEAEFDAALDAAVEAAYDDGFEPADNDDEAVQNGTLTQALGEDLVSHVRKNVEIAKQKVRDVEREAAIATATDRQARRLQQRLIGRDRSDSIEMEYGEDEAQEEERILEEMTRDYVMDDTEYDMRSKSALPRQSDSSGFSGRTWGSSIGSNPTTAGTSLSTVTENIMISPLSIHLQTKPPPPPLHPPPCGALPPPPHFSTSTIPVAAHKTSPPKPPSLGLGAGPGVRDRRLSGQNVKQLKIETNAKLRPGIAAPATQPSLMAPPAISGQEMAEPPKSASIIRDSQQTLPNLVFNLPTPQAGPRQASSTFLGPGLADRPPSASPAIPAPIRTIPLELESNTSAGPSSPARLLSKVTTGPGTLKKNFSSSSLRNARVSSTTPTASDDSPSTPMTTSFSVASLQRSNHALMMSATHTPADTTFITNGLATGGMHLFDNNIHSPRIPGSPNPLATNAPLPLEPCPESLLRRPFWLLRCVYHTVAHPRGGYISTRLFVPRDIWRVKNVKLKGVEEKVSNCDLLTAALLKLSKVDTLDADAVLEEMQSFENVLDQVQVLLVKKLGGEVGVQGMASLFKGSHTTDEAGSTNESLMSRSTNLGSKSYLSSWRKLRSKNSPGVGITPIMSGTAGKEGSRETLTMRSLPMTSNANPRLPKRDPGQVQCIGPQANYMGALARLCDAVQVLGK